MRKEETIKAVSGNDWLQKKYPESQAIAIVQRYSLPEIVSRVLAAKNISLDDIELYLKPTIRSTLPIPI